MDALLLFVLFVVFQSDKPLKIKIEPSKIDKLFLSEIAQSVISVPLKTDKFSFIDIHKVFIIKDNIFILEGGEENDEGFASRVLRFDILGNYIGQLGVKDKLSNEYKPVYNIRHNEMNQTIFLEYSDGCREYNISGDLLAFIPGSKERIIYNKHLWSVDNFPENRNSYFNLIRTNFDLQNIEVIQMPYFKLSEEWNKNVKGIIGQYSISNGELYFTNGIDNTIYLVSNNSLFPKYKVEFTDLSLTNSFLSVIQKKVIFGHFVKYGYWYKGGQYDFLYDTQTGKSFNILYFDKIGKRSGIIDDIYNSGTFTINPTNQEDYIYFIKNPVELIKSKLNNPKLTNTILFLVKLK